MERLEKEKKNTLANSANKRIILTTSYVTDTEKQLPVNSQHEKRRNTELNAQQKQSCSAPVFCS